MKHTTSNHKIIFKGLKVWEKNILTCSLTLSFLLSIFFIVTPLFASDNFTAAQGIENIAPINPAFERFISRRQSRSLRERPNAGGYATGLIPSPIKPMVHKKDAHESRRVSSYVPKYDMRYHEGNNGQIESLLTPVRDQGNCGSCWAFATFGMLEAQLKKDYGQYDAMNDYSENNIMHRHGFGGDPCGGGNILKATAYLSRYDGAVSEWDDPYDNSGYCTNCQPERYVDNVVFMPVRSETFDIRYIKEAIIDHGALYTHIYWDATYFNSHSNTYYYNGDEDSDHAVVIVGWDDNHVVPGAPGNGAFIVRNSWGEGFGENGYFYVSYYDTVIAFQALAYSDDRPEFNFDTVYYHDDLGMTTSVGYGETTGWGGNWFVPDEDGQIAAVGFYAPYPMAYEIKIYNHFSDGRFSHQLNTTKHGSVNALGWYTVQLDRPVSISKNDGFGVVVKFNTPNYDYPIPVEMPLDFYAPFATANAGESYISLDGVDFVDATDYFTNTNVCIKAFVRSSNNNSPDGDLAPLSDRDGIVNVGDALVALRFALGLETPTQQDLGHGDVAPLNTQSRPNPDEQITVGDSLVILRLALGLISFSDSTPTTTTVTIGLTGVAPGTAMGGLDLTIDYDESKVTFNSGTAGALTSGAMVIPNDNGDTARTGLIHPNGFDGGSNGSIMVFTFDVTQPNIPTAGDFRVTNFSATDLSGAYLGINTNNITINVVNQ